MSPLATHGARDGLADELRSVARALPPAVPAPARDYDAVLLLSFGGPEGQDDVIPFLRNVTSGRGIPDERLEEVSHHYRAFGGVSPINAQNRALRAALQQEIDARGLGLPVLWGNRNWHPYLADTLREAHTAGHRSLLTVVTSAYSSYSGCRQYREDLAAALQETGLDGELTIDKVRQYFDLPGFAGTFADGLARALDDVERDLPGVDVAAEVRVLFATHSIPLAAADASGPPLLHGSRPEGGAYVAQHLAVAQAVLDDVAAARPGRPVPAWDLVYQSRSGAPHVPWLEPDVNDAVRALAGPGTPTRAVVIVPLGFVSDHMEVLWDLDEEALATARSVGLHAVRVPTPGVAPAFVSGLVDLIAGRSAADAPEPPAGRAVALGPWYDVCRPGCCLNGRSAPRPALCEGNP